MEDCKLELNLTDKPGTLSQVLEIIAENRGNLFSISHLREKEKGGVLPVIITLQAKRDDFSKIAKDIEANGIEINEKRVGDIEEVHLSQEFILIGHVIDTDIRDTIYGICDKDVMVKSLDISLKSLKEPSSVFAEIGAKDKKSLEKAVKKLEKIASKKDLLLIMGIQE
jgi:ACT domain-containing protein